MRKDIKDLLKTLEGLMGGNFLRVIIYTDDSGEVQYDENANTLYETVITFDDFEELKEELKILIKKKK